MIKRASFGIKLSLKDYIKLKILPELHLIVLESRPSKKLKLCDKEKSVELNGVPRKDSIECSNQVS